METTSSQIEQVDDKFVQPVGTQLDAIATKDEQIKALITSVQDLKHQLEQHLTANETRFKTLEDCLDVTRQELNVTTITGRQMKDELTKQCEEHFKAFEKLLSSSSHGLNEELITNIPAIVTKIQNDEDTENISEEVTKIKEELAQEVIATQQSLEMTTQKFEKELTTVKEEIQTYRSEARKAEDNNTQSLTSIEAKLTASQLVSQHEAAKLTQQIKNIKNIKQDLSGTKKLYNQKLKCAEEDITAIREEMKKSHEEVSVVKQKQVTQVAALATSHNKWKENLKLISNFVIIIVIFAVLVLAASFSPYSMFCDVKNITANFNTSCHNLMRNISVDLMSNIDALSSDQGVQIQRLNDTLNAMQLQVESESELVASLHKNISIVNQTTLSIVNDVKAHYGDEITIMRNITTELSSKVHMVKDDQVLQLQKLAGVEENLNNITRSHDVFKLHVAELVAELHKNISAVNETAQIGISELKGKQILLHCFSAYGQYQKELTTKALQLERSLAKINDYASFPVIVMVSGISSMVNSKHTHNNNNYYHWANASVNIQGELLYVSLQKVDNTHFEVVLCEPLPIWCDDLIVRNQINDSSHYESGLLSLLTTDLYLESRIARIKNKEKITGCVSYSSSLTKFEELLKITSDCQYVVCDTIFISMECEYLNPNEE